MSRYRAPLWLPGGHAQTIWPALKARLPLPAYQRELWDTPDGDQLAVDRLPGPAGAPALVLFHGLEGGSDSHYACALMHAVAAQGWHGLVVHFRGCGGQTNRLPRAYHAGDSAEIAWLGERLGAEFATLFGVGVSLGGNMLLKHLGEAGANTRFSAAAAVSAPMDLTIVGPNLDRGLNRPLYTQRFLETLIPKSLAQLEQHPGLFDAARLQRARTFVEFDDLVTAPLHGFRNVHDYWQRASCKPFLKHITVPTLALNARNDPFIPARALPRAHEVSACVTLEQPRHGGHVGFVSGAFPGHIHWLPARLIEFFTQVLAQRAASPRPEST